MPCVVCTLVSLHLICVVYGHPYIPVHFWENVLCLKYLVHSGVMLQVLHSQFLVKFNMIISVACFLSQYLALNRCRECVNSGG